MAGRTRQLAVNFKPELPPTPPGPERARPLRIEYPGAAYHLMARGHQGQPIFQDDLDRKRFLETLAGAIRSAPFGSMVGEGSTPVPRR